MGVTNTMIIISDALISSTFAVITELTRRDCDAEGELALSIKRFIRNAFYLGFCKFICKDTINWTQIDCAELKWLKALQPLSNIRCNIFWPRCDVRTRNPHQRAGSWLSQRLRSSRARWGGMSVSRGHEDQSCFFGHKRFLWSKIKWFAREAETDEHEGKRKVEALWPIFKIHHQKSRW